MLDGFLSLRLNANDLSGELLWALARVVLHEWEGEDLLDTVVISQEHDQAIDTEPPSTAV
jgi:hypothetical protein